MSIPELYKELSKDTTAQSSRLFTSNGKYQISGERTGQTVIISRWENKPQQPQEIPWRLEARYCLLAFRKLYDLNLVDPDGINTTWVIHPKDETDLIFSHVIFKKLGCEIKFCQGKIVVPIYRDPLLNSVAQAILRMNSHELFHEHT
jgi:hypothetical protein